MRHSSSPPIYTEIPEIIVVPALAQPATPIPESAETVLLTWRAHPLRERPQGVLLVAFGYALAFVFWRLLFPHPVALLLPTLCLTVALSDYLFPTTYRLTNRGAHADCLFSRLFLPWSDVRRAMAGNDGVFLSPFSRASRLDTFRGVRLRFVDDNDETVCALVKQLRDSVPTTTEVTAETTEAARI